MPCRTLVLSIALISAIGCSTIEPRFVDGPSGVSYQLGAYNHIMDVTVQEADSEKVLWRFKGLGKFEHFDYGECTEKMRELTPAQPLKQGDRVLVWVQYQYDTWYAACAGNLRSEFEVVSANKFRLISP